MIMMKLIRLMMLLVVMAVVKMMYDMASYMLLAQAAGAV